jgi:UDP-glucose 4-epimerase
MKNLIITGGSGFLGSHIVERFLENSEYNITVLDLWESEEIKNLKSKNKNLHYFKLDINNYEELEKHIAKNNYFIHMAAILGTLETIITYDIEDVVRTNILGTTKILKLAKKYNYKKIAIPTTPDVTWLNPYKITKMAIEKIAQLFNKEYDLNVSCLKLGNIYGARERWLEAKLNAPFNYQKVIPSFIMDTLNNKPITIYGDGEQKSEYIYVKDVAESFFRLINGEVNTGTEIIHVGSGNNHSVLDIIEGLEKAWGRILVKNFVGMRAGEHKVEINLDPKPLKKYLDYELKWDLTAGLKETIPYYLDQFNKSK